MKLFRHNGNIISIGLILLIILSVAMFLITRTVTEIGEKMNRAVVEERYFRHYDIIKSEFDKTMEMSSFVDELTSSLKGVDIAQNSSIAEMLFKVDPKITRIWFLDELSMQTNSYYNSKGKPHKTEQANLFEREVAAKMATKEIHSAIYQHTPTPLWNLSHKITIEGHNVVFGVDISLSDLFDYMSQLKHSIISYASIYDAKGVVILHPDTLFIGEVTTDPENIDIIRSVVEKEIPKDRILLSEYLEMPINRRYYPLSIGDEKWVVAVSILSVSINDQMDNMRKYMTIITVVAFVLFIIMLAFSQYRWRREYTRRRQAERESLKSQMQSIIEQIKPHFLFNSLNSLYALINSDPEVAREFVLQLSGVYRYVLEQHKKPLSTVENEIEFTRQYLFLQKTRFGKQIDWTIDVDPQQMSSFLPSMSLQTLVENAIKHNAFTLEKPLNIKIFSSENTIVVENNYSPRESYSEKSMGTGLERLTLIYQFYDKRKFEIYRDNTTFRCTMPLLNDEDNASNI